MPVRLDRHRKECTRNSMYAKPRLPDNCIQQVLFASTTLPFFRIYSHSFEQSAPESMHEEESHSEWFAQGYGMEGLRSLCNLDLMSCPVSSAERCSPRSRLRNAARSTSDAYPTKARDLPCDAMDTEYCLCVRGYLCIHPCGHAVRFGHSEFPIGQTER